MITPYHYHNYGYIMLVVDRLANLPEQIELNENIMFKKGALHVSLMALKHLIPLINAGGHNITEDDLVRDFIEYQKTNDLSDFQPTGQFRYVKRSERETVVAMVDVPGIEGLFEMIRAKYGVNIPTQPTHITLYTLQPESSIGILSQAELKRDSRPIGIPELKI